MMPLVDLPAAAVAAAKGAAGGPSHTVAHAVQEAVATADSLGGTAADSLAAAAGTLSHAAAAAFPQVDPLLAAERASTLGGWLGGWTARAAGAAADAVQAAPAEVFGALSTLGGGTGAPPPAMPPLGGSALYQAVVLLLTAFYLLVLYTNSSEMRMLWGGFSLDSKAGRRALLDRGAIHGQFLRRCCVLGVAGTAVLAVPLCDNYLPAAAFDALPPQWRTGFCIAAMAAVGAVVAVQTAALWCIGQVTLTQSFVKTLLYVKQFHFAMAAGSVLPFVLLYALCPTGSGSGWLYAVCGLSAIIILLFLREIHSLFVTKNISNLHWILYLCTIEIAPVAFAVLMLVKHR